MARICVAGLDSLSFDFNYGIRFSKRFDLNIRPKYINISYLNISSDWLQLVYCGFSYSQNNYPVG